MFLPEKSYLIRYRHYWNYLKNNWSHSVSHFLLQNFTRKFHQNKFSSKSVLILYLHNIVNSLHYFSSTVRNDEYSCKKILNQNYVYYQHFILILFDQISALINWHLYISIIFAFLIFIFPLSKLKKCYKINVYHIQLLTNIFCF